MVHSGVPRHVGVHVPDALVVDAESYLRGLWLACENLAQKLPSGSFCRLNRRTSRLLRDLEVEFPDAAAIVVATGATAATVEEVPDRVAELLDLSHVRDSERAGLFTVPIGTLSSSSHAHRYALSRAVAVAIPTTRL